MLYYVVYFTVTCWIPREYSFNGQITTFSRAESEDTVRVLTPGEYFKDLKGHKCVINNVSIKEEN